MAPDRPFLFFEFHTQPIHPRGGGSDSAFSFNFPTLLKGMGRTD